jgi:hypothetical protein
MGDNLEERHQVWLGSRLQLHIQLICELLGFKASILFGDKLHKMFKPAAFGNN